MLPVKIFEHNGKYGLMRAEDGRHLHRHGSNDDNLWNSPDEIRELINDDMSGYLLIEDGKTYVEAYRDRWHPGVPIFNELPDGWHFMDSPTAPNGAKWARNGSYFKRDEHGKVCGKNPNYQQAYVLV